GLDVHARPAGAGLGLRCRANAGDAELSLQLLRSLRHGPAEFRRLEDDRFAAVAEDLADQPLRAADRLLRHRRAVGQRVRALLDFPACDLLRVPDLGRPGIAEDVRIEALARLEVGALDPGAA